jgi:hypothetical protein
MDNNFYAKLCTKVLCGVVSVVKLMIIHSKCTKGLYGCENRAIRRLKMEKNLAFCKAVTFRLKYKFKWKNILVKLSEHNLNFRKGKLNMYTKVQIIIQYTKCRRCND